MRVNLSLKGWQTPNLSRRRRKSGPLASPQKYVADFDPVPNRLGLRNMTPMRSASWSTSADIIFCQTGHCAWG